LHEPFQRLSTHRHLWATMVALAGVAALPKSVAFVGDVAAPDGPETQIAAASAKAAKAARMMSSRFWNN
jgi:hypothetical protein